MNSLVLLGLDIGKSTFHLNGTYLTCNPLILLKKMKKAGLGLR